MTQDTSHENEWENVRVSYMYHTMDGSETTLSDTYKRLSYCDKVFNLPEHRDKPDDLIWNQTDLPRQRTTESKSTIVRGICVSPFGYCYDSGHYGLCWRGGMTDHVVEHTPWITSAHTEQYPEWATELRLRVKDDVVNLGATLAEYRQSVSMFGSAAKGVVNAWRAFRRGKFLKKKTTCDISAAHLVYDYGVAPLMSDMYDSIEVLRHRLEWPIYRRYFFKQSMPTFVEQTDWAQSQWVDVERHTTIDRDQYICSQVKMDVDKISEFTFGNPLEIAWELVPYSFVIDWFIPIGDTLIALDALKNVERIQTSVTRKWFQFDNYTASAHNCYGQDVVPEESGYLIDKWHEREVYESVPLPSIPKLDFNASINKLLNATSLLHVARGCKGRGPRFKRSDFGQ